MLHQEARLADELVGLLGQDLGGGVGPVVGLGRLLVVLVLVLDDDQPLLQDLVEARLDVVGLEVVAPNALVPIVAGATVGAFVESALGATLEAPGIVNNDVLNFLNTTVAAAVALAAWQALS